MTAVPKKVLIITLNWRQAEMTVTCVRALQSMTYTSVEIMVIDNGSGDESPRILEEQLTNVHLRCLPENTGFAAGSNIGLLYAMNHNFEYALLINNDAFPAPDMLSILMAATSPDIALISPKIYYEADPKRIWFAGGRQHPTLLELRNRGQGELDGPSWQSAQDVDYLVGTCLLVNLTAAKKVGLLNEQFFMYYEDLDWCIRFRTAGYRLKLVADAHLYHRVATSSGGTDSPLRRYYLARSSFVFFYSHRHQGNPWAILAFRTLTAIKQVGVLLLSGKRGGAKAYLRGLRDGYRLVRESTKV